MFDMPAVARHRFVLRRSSPRRARAAALALGLAAPLIIGRAAAQEPTPGATATASVEVRIDNFAFTPATITVAPGTAVTWINADDIPHTVTADDHRSFRSKALDTDDRFTFTFTAPGEYAYFCSLHPHMTGTVVVTAASPSASAAARPGG